MPTDYDQSQDAKIAENGRQIDATLTCLKQQAELLREILYFHKPWLKSPWKTKFRVKFYGPFLKLAATVTLFTGLYKTAEWYCDLTKINRMAARYVMVAKRMYYEENNPLVAMEFLDKAIKMKDGSAEYRFLRAYIEGLSATSFLLNLDRPVTKPELDIVHKALAEAIFLENFEPSRPEAYLLEAQIYTGLKEYERAEDALSKALQKRPDSSYAHMRLGALRLQRADASGAEKELDAAQRLNSKSKWVWLWRGVLANDFKRDPEAARACYEKALSIDSKFDMAIYNLGWTWANGKDKDYKRARKCMLEVLKLNPAYKEACYAMGMLYGYEDNYAVAKVWLDKAIQLDSKFLSAWKMRGVVKMEMKEYASAVADFDEAILLDPTNAELFTRRAKALLALGRTDEALRDLVFARDLQPTAKRTWLYLGDAYLAKGEVGAAAAAYDKAIELDDAYADAYARKAELFVKKGNKSAALHLLKKAEESSSQGKERFSRRIEELSK